MTPSTPDNGPDFSDVDSLAKARELCDRGQLEKLHLMPLGMGGEDIAQNVVYVPVGLADVKARIDDEVIRPLVQQGKLRGYQASPKYHDRSHVPISIEIVATGETEFRHSIAIWGDGLRGAEATHDNATIYALTEGPPSLELVRRLAPSAKIDVRTRGWLRRVEGFDVTWPDATIKIDLMPGREIDEHLKGLWGFIERAPGRPAPTLLDRARRVRQVLAVVIRPGYDEAGACAGLILGLARELGSFVVTPDGIREPDGTWLKQLAADPPGETPEVHDADAAEAVPPPSAERVTRRALALAAVAFRSVLEREHGEPGTIRMLGHLRDWVNQIDLVGELEDEERAIVFAPPGSLTERQAIDGSWRGEGLVVLAWSLGLTELPAHDMACAAEKVSASVGLLSPDPPQVRRLRPAEELAREQRRLLGLHWRLRDFGLNGKSLDFVRFSRTCWFGGFDLAGIPLADGDLALGGVPLSKAPAEQVRFASSIAQERHQAINWLMGDHATYSQVDTST